MDSRTTRGIICMDGRFGAVYRICPITYTVWEDDSFEYVFEPNYLVIDLLTTPDFQGIPGLDLSLRKQRYVRRNRVPTFIEERSPAPNREDLWDLLDEHGMDHLNRLEWLIRTRMRYGGDNLYVQRFEEQDELETISETELVENAQNTDQAMRALLNSLARGDGLKLADGAKATPDARKALHSTLIALLEKGEAYRKMKSGERETEKRGRRRIAVEDTRFEEALRDIADGRLTVDEAANRLGISRSTFFRRKRELG